VPVRKASVRCLANLVLLAAAGQAHAAVEDRINEAMPVSKAVDYARSELLRLAADSGNRSQVESELNAKLRVRAIDCAQGYAPGPFTSKEEIAARFGATDCFEHHDDELARWIGWRRVGLMVRMPPLRPIPKVSPPYVIGTDYVQQVKFASNAGVVLLWTNRTLELLDLNNGKRIARVEGMGGDTLGELSPNGRVLTLSMPGGTSLIDVETGESLARVQAIFPADFSWLGPDHAMILRSAMLSSFTVDFDTGAEHPLKFTKEPINRVVPSPTAADEFIALTSTSAMRIKVGEGRLAEPVTLLDEKPFKVENWLRTPGVVTADGRTYVVAAHDLNFVSASSLTMTTVTVAPFDVRNVVPLPNPDLILLSGENPGVNRNMGLRRYVYSLSRQTFAPVNQDEMNKGRIVYLPTVRKLAIVTQNRVAFVDTLPMEAAISNDDFVTTLNLEQEQSRAAMTQQDRIPHVSGVGPVRVETIPGARVMMQTSGDRWTVTSTPDTANVEGVGIDHAANVISKPDGTREGIVVVHVKRGSGSAIVLLLSSHEAVRWSLNVERGAVLKSILTAGPDTSMVSGAGAIPIRHITNTDASQANGPDYQRLQAEVIRASGSQIHRFQGVLVGSEFTVDGR
jgi:hypothetical protein